jgi:hypothetical protein
LTIKGWHSVPDGPFDGRSHLALFFFQEHCRMNDNVFQVRKALIQQLVKPPKAIDQVKREEVLERHHDVVLEVKTL